MLGPNGAGKTTLLRLLSTTLEPTAGTALVDGMDVRGESGRVRARIGLLVETAGLYARFTPREHLRFYGLFIIWMVFSWSSESTPFWRWQILPIGAPRVSRLVCAAV